MPMVSKLLSEFDTYYQCPQPQQPFLPAPSIGESTGSVFDDLACLDANAAQPSAHSPRKLPNGPLSWSQENGEMNMLHSSNIGKVKNAVLSGKFSPPHEGSKTVAANNQNRETNTEGDSEVIFAAFAEIAKADDEDEFGDFESGVHLPQPDISNPSLMSSLDDGLEKDYTEPETVPFSATASQTGLSHGTQSGALKSTGGTPSNDGWGDFEDVAETALMTGDVLRNSTDEVTASSKIESSKHSTSTSILIAPLNADEPHAMNSLAYTSARRSSTSGAECPSPAPDTMSSLNANRSQTLQTSAAPSNVPPPSVLLPLLTTILQHQYNTIFSVQERGKSSPAETSPIPNLIQLAIIAAHIIAGRKLRWKRDMLLAQNMRIGPSHSGKAGGMKLTGIDKAETLREDREVVDLVRIWKDHLGRVRSTIGTANPSGASMSTSIPTLTETLPVKTVNGSLTATKGCALCGLRREERVDKVDELVEDSFGEWWVDHWGHTTCKWFWDRYHDGLQQRY